MYETLLDLLAGSPRDEFEASAQPALEVLEQPDLYAPALVELTFFRTV